MGAYSGIGLGLRGAGSLTAAPHIGKATGPSYNTNAKAYFDAVELYNSTAFDLSSYNASYTTEYVKDVHNNLFNDLDSIWSNIAQFVILCGKTSALGVPAKGATMFVNNYSSINYNPTGAVGTAIGLRAGSGQYLSVAQSDNTTVLPVANKDNVTFNQVVTGASGVLTSGFYYSGAGDNSKYETEEDYNTVKYYYGLPASSTPISSATGYATVGFWTYGSNSGTVYISKNGAAPLVTGSSTGSNYTGSGSTPYGDDWRFTDGGGSGRYAMLMSYKSGTAPSDIKSSFKTFIEALGDTGSIP